MEIKKKLLMTFKTDDDNKVSITVDSPRENLTEAQILDAMNVVVEKNVFASNGESFVALVSAKVVETGTTEFDLVL